jgi:unsaturated rhamnogalacturonyl hydrolase
MNRFRIMLPALLAAITLLGACRSAGTNAAKITNVDRWSVRMAESEMVRNPQMWTVDFVTEKKWNYTQGLMGLAAIRLSDTTGNEKYLIWAKGYADSLIDDNGVIWNYRMENYNLDQVNPGKMLFLLYDKTGDQRYLRAVETLRSQLATQPRTAEGGFWHKKVYPQQMWLDGLYMGAPFYAEYAARNNRQEDFSDVVNQFLLAAKHTYDPVTGLYRHAWDASGAMPWADRKTGQAPHAWGRAMGWFSMAIVDALDFIPEDQPGRDEMITILRGMFEALVKIQDPETGGWYQVPDRSGEPGNYIETSCTSMFTYSMLKGVRMGYLDKKYLESAMKAYKGLIDNFIVTGSDGLVNLTGICGVAGLGGDPYRDGSYEYYINEVVRDNDPKGVAPFIMASLEYESINK